MVFCVCPTYSAWGSAWLLFCCPFYATRFWQQILRGRDLEPPSHPSGTPMESFFPWRMSRFLHQAFIKLTRSAYGWPMSLGGSSGKLASSKSSVATGLNFSLPLGALLFQLQIRMESALPIDTQLAGDGALRCIPPSSPGQGSTPLGKGNLTGQELRARWSLGAGLPHNGSQVCSAPKNQDFRSRWKSPWRHMGREFHPRFVLLCFTSRIFSITKRSQ